MLIGFPERDFSFSLAYVILFFPDTFTETRRLVPRDLRKPLLHLLVQFLSVVRKERLRDIVISYEH